MSKLANSLPPSASLVLPFCKIFLPTIPQLLATAASWKVLSLCSYQCDRSCIGVVSMHNSHLLPSFSRCAEFARQCVRAINSISSRKMIVVHFPSTSATLAPSPTEQYRPVEKCCLNCLFFKPGESIWWRWPLVRLKYQSQSKEALVRVSEWGWRGSCRPRSGSQVSHQRLDRHCDHRQSGTEEFRVTTLWQDGTCERNVCL